MRMKIFAIAVVVLALAGAVTAVTMLTSGAAAQTSSGNNSCESESPNNSDC